MPNPYVDAVSGGAAGGNRGDQGPAPVTQVKQTSLSPEEEQRYQAWKATLPGRLQYEGDYDLRGFYHQNPNFSVDVPGQHMTDEFKLPNHPTFSDESKYYGPQTQRLGGHWFGDMYVPYDDTMKSPVDETPPKEKRKRRPIP